MSGTVPRRIVQIAGDSYLFALASDGTLWEFAGQKEPLKWRQLPPLPDREVEVLQKPQPTGGRLIKGDLDPGQVKD